MVVCCVTCVQHNANAVLHNKNIKVGSVLEEKLRELQHNLKLLYGILTKCTL